MFLTHPQQTKDNFKEVIQNLLDDCLDIENKINPELLPETLRAKEAAWLIVCVQLGGEVDLSNDDLFFLIAKKARRFHNHIHSKYYQRTEGIEQIDMTDSFAGEDVWDFTITKDKLNKIRNEYHKLKENYPHQLPNIIFFTNIPFHYGQLEQPNNSAYGLVITRNPRKKFRHEVQIINSLRKSLAQYSFLPKEFEKSQKFAEQYFMA